MGKNGTSYAAPQLSIDTGEAPEPMMASLDIGEFTVTFPPNRPLTLDRGAL